jgi:hypothetical protein
MECELGWSLIKDGADYFYSVGELAEFREEYPRWWQYPGCEPPPPDPAMEAACMAVLSPEQIREMDEIVLRDTDWYPDDYSPGLHDELAAIIAKEKTALKDKPKKGGAAFIFGGEHVYQQSIQRKNGSSSMG